VIFELVVRVFKLIFTKFLGLSKERKASNLAVESKPILKIRNKNIAETISHFEAYLLLKILNQLNDRREYSKELLLFLRINFKMIAKQRFPYIILT
jgi:hypothetical protein